MANPTAASNVSSTNGMRPLTPINPAAKLAMEARKKRGASVMSTDALGAALEGEKAAKAVEHTLSEIKKDTEKAMASSRDLGTTLDTMTQKLGEVTTNTTTKVTALVSERDELANENRVLKEQNASLSKSLDENRGQLCDAHETIKTLKTELDSMNLKIVTNTGKYMEAMNQLLDQIQTQKMLLAKRDTEAFLLATKLEEAVNSSE